MQVAVWAIFEDEVVEVGCLDDLVQPKDVFVDQVPVNLYFCLEHFEIGPTKLLQFDHFYGITFMDLFYLYSLVDLATVALAQFILGGILVDANFHFSLFQCV